MIKQKLFGNEQGAVLVTGLMFLAILTLIGTTAYLTTSNELKTSRNYRISKKVFYDAEAGIEYALAMIEADLVSGSISLPSSGNTISSYDAPAGLSFTLSSIAGTTVSSGKKTWSLTSTGADPNSSASAEVMVLFYRESLIDYAAFGDQSLVLKAGAKVFSYNSADTNPCTNDPSCTVNCYAYPADSCFVSTGQGDVGSNGQVTMDNGAIIDGDVQLGNDGGSPPTPAGFDGTEAPNYAAEYIPREEPDPLGIGPGDPYDPASYSDPLVNDNDLIGGVTTISGPLTLCPKAGGGETNYYFTLIELGNLDKLTIDTLGNTNTTNDPLPPTCSGPPGKINIFLDDPAGFKPLKMNNSAEIEVTSDRPGDFGLFSNATGTLELKNSTQFYGLVYAPDAQVDLKNSMTIYGSVWASTITEFATAEIYFDTAIMEKYPADDVTVSYWSNMRN